jgi:hypothetical protein
MVNATNSFSLNRPCTFYVELRSDLLRRPHPTKQNPHSNSNLWPLKMMDHRRLSRAHTRRPRWRKDGCRMRLSPSVSARVPPWGRRCAHSRQPWSGCVLRLSSWRARCLGRFLPVVSPPNTARSRVTRPRRCLHRLAVHLPGETLLPSRFTYYRYTCATVPNLCSPWTYMTPETCRLSMKRLLNSLVLPKFCRWCSWTPLHIQAVLFSIRWQT